MTTVSQVSTKISNDNNKRLVAKFPIQTTHVGLKGGETYLEDILKSYHQNSIATILYNIICLLGAWLCQEWHLGSGQQSWTYNYTMAVLFW